MRHWLAVVSLDHATTAVAFGFLQVCHGKAGPLRRTAANDEVFIYCPKTAFVDGASLMSLHFRGLFADDHIYRVEQFPGFAPYRKNVVFDKTFRPILIRGVAGLQLTAKPSWGVIVRRGFVELAAEDAERIRTQSEAQP